MSARDAHGGQKSVGSTRAGEFLSQEGGGTASLHASDLFWSSCRHDLPARITGTWTHVDYPIRLSNGTHVVLNHDHRIAGINEPLELHKQPIRVRGMEARSGFIQDIQCPPALASLKLCGQLDALRFTTR